MRPDAASTIVVTCHRSRRMVAAEFSFDGDLRHAGYIETWIGLLRQDKLAFFTAASKAQGAADYLRGLALAEPIAEAA